MLTNLPSPFSWVPLQNERRLRFTRFPHSRVKSLTRNYDSLKYADLLFSLLNCYLRYVMLN
jgi:hypothetical protein